MLKTIDLRSDTLTLPTPAMREAMYKAEVGDDGRVDDAGRGGDPSINRLEDRGAELLGKETALFFPSGTFGNFAALLTHCQRGDSVACDMELHVVRTEKAAFMDRYAGLHIAPYTRDEREMPDAASFEQACSAPGVRLACLENTHNYAGGTCTSLERMRELSAIAKKKGLPVHLDGARLFNAALALGVPVSDLAACADTVQFCLSKGLGAPVGSLLCGPRDFIQEVRQTRKLLGGGMRQAGIVAAAGMVALEQGVERLAEDHENAALLGKAISAYPMLAVVPVQTNIVMVKVKASGRPAPWFAQKLAERGVLTSASSEEQLRFTTYRGVTRADIEETVARFAAFMEEQRAEFSA